VADINADKHGLGTKLLAELQTEKISPELGVDLSQDVAGNGEIHSSSIFVSTEVFVLNTLRDQLKRVAHVLVWLVEAFMGQHY
jgi:hypothetical protein